MRPLVGVYRFQVHHVADHLELLGNAVSAVHVAGVAGNLQRLAAVVALDDRDHLGRSICFIQQTTDAQAGLQAKADLGHHVGKLQLEDLGAGDRLAKLLAVKPILTRGVVAELGRTKHTPADAIAGAVEAAERTFQPLDARQQRVLAHLYILHHDLAGDRGPQAELAADLRRRKALHALVQHKAADLAAMCLGLGPDHEDIGDRAVRDPHLGAIEHIAIGGLAGDGLHPGRV